MGSKEVQYIYDESTQIEIIRSKQSNISYLTHNHVSIYTIGMIFLGEIELTLGSEKQILGPNQTFLVVPYMPHSIKVRHSYSMISICIGKNKCKHIEEQTIKEVVGKLMLTGELEQLNGEQIERLLQMVKLLGVMLENKEELGVIERVAKGIEDHPEREFNVEEMAVFAHMSKYHFIRSFKKEIGLTPHQFQIQNRVRKAQHLLERKDSSIEVALTAGFYDQSHFIKQFKKIIGLTPISYWQAYKMIQSKEID